MQDTQYIAQLLKKSRADALSAKEEAELHAWAGSDEVYEALLARVQRSHVLEELLLLRHELAHHDDGRDYTDRLRGTLGKHLHLPEKKPRQYWLPYAAAVLVGVVAVAWMFSSNRETPQQAVARMERADIQPGGNRATLTLATGQTVALSEEQSGILVGGEMTYLDGSDVLGPAEDSLAMVGSQGTDRYMLATPRGGTYQITLPDGTNVWLNAESTLIYPATFRDDERVVEVVGEAYFDVTEDRERPFRVLSKGQAIEVLGTEFNIAAYPDESEVKTTLIEGRVLVKAGTDHQSPVTMAPGEQTVVRHGQLHKVAIDVSSAIAWKSGKFNFNEKPFGQVMKEVSRWYDLQVVYEGAIPTGQLVGDAYRNQNLSIVLGMLDVLEIDYELNVPDRRLTIYNTGGKT